MGEILGRVVTVAGSQITVNPEAALNEGSVRIGVHGQSAWRRLRGCR